MGGGAVVLLVAVAVARPGFVRVVGSGVSGFQHLSRPAPTHRPLGSGLVVVGVVGAALRLHLRAGFLLSIGLGLTLGFVTLRFFCCWLGELRVACATALAASDANGGEAGVGDGVVIGIGWLRRCHLIFDVMWCFELSMPTWGRSDFQSFLSCAAHSISSNEKPFGMSMNIPPSVS